MRNLWRTVLLAAAVSAGVLGPRAAPRRLIEADKLKEILTGIVKENLWTAADPADNAIIVNEKVGDADVAVFRVTLAEVEIPGSTQKRQTLTIDNRPKEPTGDPFARFKNYQLLFRRKVTDKDVPILGVYLRHCIAHFKRAVDRLNAARSAPSLLAIVTSAFEPYKQRGLTLTVEFNQPRQNRFLIVDSQGNERFLGHISPLTEDIMGCRLAAPEETFQVFFMQGAEASFQEKIARIFAARLVLPPALFGLTAIKTAIAGHINRACPNGIKELTATAKDNYIAVQYGSAGGAACLYTNAKLLLIKDTPKRLGFVHLSIDFPEFAVEDIMWPGTATLDRTLTISMNKNLNTYMFIQNARRAGNKEVVADETAVKKALVEAIGGEPAEVDIPGDLKTAAEVEERKWLHEWKFPNGVVVDLFQNPEDFVVQVLRVTPTGASTTSVVVPLSNGYDHLALLKAQTKEFLTSAN